MKKKFLKHWLISAILLLSFIQFIYGQDTLPIVYTPKGILWVVPKRADALPVNGNRTGNSGLNLAFEDYHVIEYVFLDSLYFTEQLDINGIPIKKPVYQIRLQEEYAHWDISMIHLLNNCYYNLFDDYATPYNYEYNNGQTLNLDNGLIVLEFENQNFSTTLFPRSETRSFNKPMNLILKKYDIKSYSYFAYPPVSGGDTTYRTIHILCHYQDALPLFYDLQNINYLYDYISIARSFFFGESDFSNPCGEYSDISSEEKKSIQVFPNPAQDEITISGITPESVKMYDVMGKMVLSEFNSETNKIDIKKLPNGLYIIKIITYSGEIFSNKIVKQ